MDRNGSRSPYRDSYEIYRKTILNETFHVVDEMQDVAEDIFNTVEKEIDKLSEIREYESLSELFRTVDKTLYYTGWNIRSFVEVPKEKFLHHKSSPFFVKCNDE